jgi:hypothetical protein
MGRELQEPETSDAIARILGPAQARQHVLHMRGVQELQSPELYKRDAAQRQFDLERRAVVRGAEQNSLML